MKYKIALGQAASSSDPEYNLVQAENALKVAKDAGAGILLLPECFLATFHHDMSDEKRQEYIDRMSALGREYGIWMVYGMYEPYDGKRNYNTTVVADDKGRIVATYRKTHLYDAPAYMESHFNVAGDKLFDPIDTPFGRLGLMVCYELRFPEVARYQLARGAEVILVPTAWLSGSDKVEQLRVVTQCRASENTVFVVMCDMCKGQRAGHSMVASPRGKVMAEAGEDEETIVVEIDLDDVKKAREITPVLESRRPELYD